MQPENPNNGAVRIRTIILFSIVIFSIIISFAIKIVNFVSFYEKDSMLFAPDHVVKARLYGADREIIEKGLALPTNSHILVFKRHYMPNYYLYPRQLFYIPQTDADEKTIATFVAEHNINRLLIEKDGTIEFSQVGGVR